MKKLGLYLLRGGTIAASLAVGVIAFFTFLQVVAVNGINLIDIALSLLILVSTIWLAWGGMQGIIGLTSSAKRPLKHGAGWISGRTVVLMPVYNEDPLMSFTRLAAMDKSIKQADAEANIHFAILSDTRDNAIAQQEEDLFVRLVEECNGRGRFFYRRRAQNVGKKAGNVEEFFEQSGGAYDYAVILDADSLMEGQTILEMIRRMEAEPRLGLLQTLPKIIRAETRFGRAMQFAASFYSPVFCRGLAMLQGKTGPFWGHNAIVRVQAFVQSCGLPVLQGMPPFGGHIMSHDYVEAALLARAGWIVRVDDDLEGSFEEGPENVIDHAKRDRRWCQGNLQHARIITAPGLKAWSRFVFAQGIMAYIAPLFWLVFLLVSILAPYFDVQPDYFPEANWPIPYIPPSMTFEALSLLVGIFGLLLLPKLLVAVKASLTGQASSFGGIGKVFVSTLFEVLLSSLIAPIVMLFTTRSVYQVLMGKDGGWPTNNRGDGQLSWRESFFASSWISLVGLCGLLVAYQLTPSILYWLLPVALPIAFAPVILWWSSRVGTNTCFTVPADRNNPPIVDLHDALVEKWTLVKPKELPQEDTAGKDQQSEGSTVPHLVPSS
ncbi:membrane glycosyltransferase [Cohaesibacter marisflavi]|uniref:Glucans biosynthesis glucosyltransferase H n=1 Tax=Cohaesibacter marisflavi TaxID=655353 RepID=A0A1I5G0C0_9HYPH|nr:glucans biosynthesis glucosyltransferase MdoH [Cohaesibacter marisflavi]SFO29454.1 membrane glycosyltransferase [Cohaesibacter marisflavi]